MDKLKKLILNTSSSTIQQQIRDVIHYWRKVVEAKSAEAKNTSVSRRPDSSEKRIKYIKGEPQLYTMTKKEREAVKEQERQWQLLVGH